LPNIVYNIDKKCIEYVSRISWGAGGGYLLEEVDFDGYIILISILQKSIMKVGTLKFYKRVELLYHLKYYGLLQEYPVRLTLLRLC
jgi:hypothetical protein